MSTVVSNATPVERRKPPVKNQPKDYGWTLYLIIITVLMVAGYFISYDQLYKAGDKIGYNMGLAGGLMMLTLLFYPLRKRIPFMNKLGVLPTWFKWHMVFGIFGPALILFHSTFTIGSINAGVAMVCMMLVSGSGIFGRFFYTRIHSGLYGRKTSFEQLQKDMDDVGDVNAIFSFVPTIPQQLTKFRETVLRSAKTGTGTTWNFLTLGVRTAVLTRRLVRELEEAMYADAHKKNWNKAQMKRLDEMFHQNRQFIELYLKNVQDSGQFSTFDKLFSLWHIFHVPLVYMLVLSAIWHVIAVHKY